MVYIIAVEREFFGGPLNGYNLNVCFNNFTHYTYDGDYRINWLYRLDAENDMCIYEVTAEESGRLLPPHLFGGDYQLSA